MKVIKYPWPELAVPLAAMLFIAGLYPRTIFIDVTSVAVSLLFWWGALRLARDPSLRGLPVRVICWGWFGILSLFLLLTFWGTGERIFAHYPMPAM